MGIVPNCGVFIIRELNCGGTGDRVYQDHNGDIWRSNHGYLENYTGVEHGKKQGNFIIPIK
ncbi:hypothetical protein LCGC14_1775960 [marine sediment metagenome]|uniref:Uncharacterized protein n=1 Tax=marine sediment metagenome TaxID=412755 RepID=A0A0F9JWL4_9ZZZZ